MAVAGYNIYLGGVKQNTSLVTDLTYALSGLTASTAYNVGVTSVDTAGNESDMSAVANFTTQAATGGTSTLDHFWGVRKHNPDYTGNALQIRRESDSADFEVGFSGNDLDTSTFSANIASGSAYVGKAYDQYGNVPLVQTIESSSRQPLIYNSGVLETRQSRPNLKFAGTQNQLIGDSSITAENGLTIIVVHSNTTTSGSNKGILGKWGATAEYGLLSRHFASPNDISVISKNSSDVQTNSQSGVVLNVASTKVIVAIFTASEEIIRVNGVEVSRTPISGGVRAAANNFVLGGYQEGQSFNDTTMYVSEVGIAKRVMTTTEIEAEEAAINTYYNTIY